MKNILKMVVSTFVCACLIISLAGFNCSAADDVKYTITVDSKLNQEITGWGVTAGMPRGWMNYGYDSQTYRDLGFNFFRYELLPTCGNSDGSINTVVLDKICQLIQRQVNMGCSRYMFSVWTPPTGMLNIEDPKKFAKTYAQYVGNVFDYVTKKWSLPAPYAFSVQNEPTFMAEWSSNTYGAEEYIEMFLAVNEEIDKRGYTSVKMIGPESAGLPQAERTFGKNLILYDENPEFQEALDIFCVHSYRGGLDKDRISKQAQEQMDHFVNIVRSHDFEELWQTEYCPVTNTSAALVAKDHSMFIARLFIADMAYAQYNCWFWWTTFSAQTERMLTDKYANTDLYYGLGSRKARLTGKAQVLTTVFKNVPIGSRMQRVSSTDPAALMNDGPFMDGVAFYTNHGTVLMYNNANDRSVTYDIKNLDGKTATVYTLDQVNEREERNLRVLEKRNINNRRINNVTLPANSVNLVICENIDTNAPDVRLTYGGKVISNNDTLYCSGKTLEINAQSDEDGKITVNGKKVNLKSDLSFDIEADLNEVTDYAVKAVDKFGNESEKRFKVVYDPKYIELEVDDVPEKYGYDKLSITGVCDAYTSVKVNGISAEKDGEDFKAEINLKEGLNNIIVEAANENGGYIKNSYETEVSFITPKLTLKSENNIITNNSEYLAVLSSDMDVAKLTINGEMYQSDLLYNYKGDRDDYEFRLFLNEGKNEFKIEAFSEYGRNDTVDLVVEYVPDESVAVVDNGEIDVRRRNGNIVIDGILDEDDWVLNHRLKNDYYNVGRSLISWDVLWDDDGLYIAGDVKSSEYNNVEDQIPWCDCFEVFLDPDNKKAGNFGKKDMQLFYGYTNENKKYDNTAKYGSRLDGMEWEFVRYGDAGNYAVEIFIPWTALQIEPADGKEIGFDISVDDPLKREYLEKKSSFDLAPRCVTTWNGSVNNWCDTSVFGTLTLRK